MRKIAYLVCCVALTGCASAYDQSAMEMASADMQVAVRSCQAKLPQFRSVAEGTECLLSADQAFANEIKLRDKGAFLSYASKMRALAVDADALRTTPEAFGADSTTIRIAYYTTIYQSQERVAEQRAAGAQALAVFGAGMAQAQAQAQAQASAASIQSVFRPPVRCTSSRAGSIIVTNCN